MIFQAAIPIGSSTVKTRAFQSMVPNRTVLFGNDSGQTADAILFGIWIHNNDLHDV